MYVGIRFNKNNVVKIGDDCLIIDIPEKSCDVCLIASVPQAKTVTDWEKIAAKSVKIISVDRTGILEVS